MTDNKPLSFTPTSTNNNNATPERVVPEVAESQNEVEKLFLLPTSRVHFNVLCNWNPIHTI